MTSSRPNGWRIVRREKSERSRSGRSGYAVVVDFVVDRHNPVPAEQAIGLAGRVRSGNPAAVSALQNWRSPCLEIQVMFSVTVWFQDPLAPGHRAWQPHQTGSETYQSEGE